jgi:hypothetical protein
MEEKRLVRLTPYPLERSLIWKALRELIAIDGSS